MTQILRDWLRAEPGRSVTTSYLLGQFDVCLRSRFAGLLKVVSLARSPDLDTAERLAVLNATGELEAEE